MESVNLVIEECIGYAHAAGQALLDTTPDAPSISTSRVMFGGVTQEPITAGVRHVEVALAYAAVVASFGMTVIRS